jgi:hypothetical protein
MEPLKKQPKKSWGNFGQKIVTIRGQVVSGNEPFEKYQALGSWGEKRSSHYSVHTCKTFQHALSCIFVSRTI